MKFLERLFNPQGEADSEAARLRAIASAKITLMKPEPSSPSTLKDAIEAAKAMIYSKKAERRKLIKAVMDDIAAVRNLTGIIEAEHIRLDMMEKAMADMEEFEQRRIDFALSQQLEEIDDELKGFE
jgi:type III secretory pathway lipoprotein EscJ